MSIYSSSLSKYQRRFNAIIYVLVVIAALVSLFPSFYAILLASITEKAGYQMYDNPAVIFSSLTWDNFMKTISGTNIVRWTVNSFIVSITHTVLYLIIASLAAFAFSRLRFKGRKALFRLCLLSMLIPGIINCVPNYIIIRSVGLLDNLWAMILPGLSGVGGVFLLKQFMDNIPSDFDEVARVEGASNFTIYSQVIIPMCKPVLVSQAIFSFQGAWNDFLWPIIITSSDEHRTLASGLYKTLMSQSQYRGSLMAASIISAIPIVVVFIFGQKYFTEGIGRGGLKG